jgi:G3E family GTPase
MSVPVPAVVSESSPVSGVPTPLLLLTGFLGSGKTTLLNRWLSSPHHPRIGVVVNEFGQVGIDAKLLPGSGIVELANGCVCCAKGTELWETALDLVDRASAEMLIVETSGLVEPQALFVQHELLPKAILRRLDLRGLLCVVDPLHLQEAIEKRNEARQQVECADRIVLSKLDLARELDLARVHGLLDDLCGTKNRVGLSLNSTNAELAELFLWAFSPREKPRRPPFSQTLPHGGNQVQAVSVALPQPLLFSPLRQLLDELPGEVLRAKGFVRLYDPNTQQTTLRVVQLAGRRIELMEPSGALVESMPQEGVLVFLGEDLDERWLRLRLTACAASSP